MSAGTALRDDFCRRLENRRGIVDACAVDGDLDAPVATRNEGQGYAESIPSIVYGRGDVDPAMPTTASHFSTMAAERLSETLAGRFFGKGTGVSASPGERAASRDQARELADDDDAFQGAPWNESLTRARTSPSLAHSFRSTSRRRPAEAECTRT
jgi:hypothetical protein